MPFTPEQEKQYQNAYNKGYQQGFRMATIFHLGAKCVVCGNTNIRELEVHHINGLEGTNRNQEDYKDLAQIELRCKPTVRDCHKDTPNWRKRRNGDSSQAK